jgi:hypothetical protein
MGKGSGYVKHLSKEECVKRLDNFLKVVEEDYNFLWEGSPSPLDKYAKHQVNDLMVYSGKELRVENDLAGSDNGFVTMGIVKKDGVFNFYLQSWGDNNSLVGNGKVVYDILEKQFALNTEYCMDGWAESICRGIEKIIEKDMREKLKDLRKKI